MEEDEESPRGMGEGHGAVMEDFIFPAYEGNCGNSRAEVCCGDDVVNWRE